jgi:predicted DNA binding protein
MLTARLSVRYPGDWTEQIGRLGVNGDIYTATLHEREYMGLIRLQGETLDEALDLIREAPYHERVEVVQHEHPSEIDDREQATVLVTAHLENQTPFLVMLQNGYMPLDPTGLKHGREYFDLIIRDRERLIELVESLDSVGDVAIERVLSEVETRTPPSQVAWTSMLADLTDRQFEALSLAVAAGYFDVPRGATLVDVADGMGVEKSTAGEHLRRGLGRVCGFVVEHAKDPGT